VEAGPPVGDPLRFSTIAHAGREILGPFDSASLDAFVDDVPVRRDGVALDLGTGKGSLPIRLAHRRAVAALGVDRNPWFVADGLAAVGRARLGGLVDLRVGDAATAALATLEGSMDLAACVGASGIFGGTRETLDALARVVRPGGLIVLGEGYWRQTPERAWLEEFEIGADEMTDVDGTVAAGSALGLEPLEPLLSSMLEWDGYEEHYAGSVERWAAAHPDDPERDAFVERASWFRDTYARWRRDALGFGLFTFRRPR
jgi:SAM-dependent methyltransferase